MIDCGRVIGCGTVVSGEPCDVGVSRVTSGVVGDVGGSRVASGIAVRREFYLHHPISRRQRPTQPVDSMEHITAIQETIDQNRDAMPTEVARQVLASTQKLYDSLDKPKLYRVTLTHVHAVSFVDCDEAVVKLQDITQTLILESIDDDPTFRRMSYADASCLVLTGKIHEIWLSEKIPKVMNHGAEMLIIHSIEPYTPKRPRWQDA